MARNKASDPANRVREFRILKYKAHTRTSPYVVQFGFWEDTGKTRRFVPLAEWLAATEQEANVTLAKLKVELMLTPLLPPPEARPMVEHKKIIREFRAAAETDHYRLVREAVEALPDPLPEIDELSQQMNLELPALHGPNVQFHVHLSAPAYRRLLAMAVHAQVTRGRMVEALIFSSGNEE